MILWTAFPAANAFPLAANSNLNLDGVVPTKSKTGEEFGSPAFWWHIVISVFLVLLGGVFSGLTLGLMGLDGLHLRVLARRPTMRTRGKMQREF